MLEKALKSRTVWVLVFMFFVGGVQALQPVMPPETFVLVQAVLTALAGYFKLNPSQTY